MFTICSKKLLCAVTLIDEDNNPGVIRSNPECLQVSTSNTRIRTDCVLNGHPENAV